jgi:micrococcal nuclease
LGFVSLSFAFVAALAFVLAVDGDTLHLQNGDKKLVVRLAQIDAPERGQPYWRVSRDRVRALCINQQVSIEPVDVDRYGRLVAEVRCGRYALNFTLVEEGLAWCYPKYLKDVSCIVFERAARESRLGLWQDSQPIAPWDWRSRGRESSLDQRSRFIDR